MAVRLSNEDVAKLGPNARAQLSSVKPNERPAAKTAKPARTQPTRRERVYNTARTRTVRVAARQGNRAGTSFGAVFGLITTAGVVLAVLKNPKLVTVPLRFIGTVVGAFGKVFGAAASTVGKVVP
jgi:hypothetical protein